VGPDGSDALLFWLDGSDGIVAALQGLRVQVATTASMFRALLRSFRSGVVAVSMPPAAGSDLEAVARACRGKPAIRSLLANHADAIDERLRALEMGFDDAVPNVLDQREIAQRIARLRELARWHSPTRLLIGPDLELDLTARALRRAGRLIHLRPLEYRLLAELARQRGTPVSRSWLLQNVWGSRPSDDSRTVDVHVRWLREKLEPEPQHPIHILTVRGVGYQLEPGDQAERAHDLHSPRVRRSPLVNTTAKAR
jgi:two-component system response regulator MtrA